MHNQIRPATPGHVARPVLSVGKATAEHGDLAEILRLMKRNQGGSVVKLAPLLARRILAELNFPRNRPVNRARMQKYLDYMRNGRWRADMGPISLAVLPDGRMWLVDGQHRLIALVEFDVAMPVNIALLPVASEAEAARLYGYFDQPDSIRTLDETLRGVGVGEDIALSSRMRKSCYKALQLIAANFDGTRNIGGAARGAVTDDRIALFDEWELQIEQWQRIRRACQSSHSRKFETVGVAAVGLVTLRYQLAKAHEFWLGIAHNDGLARRDPRAVLIADFHTRRSNSGSSHQSYQAPSIAWNHFYQGLEIAKLRCTENAPILIYGTPWEQVRS